LNLFNPRKSLPRPSNIPLKPNLNQIFQTPNINILALMIDYNITLMFTLRIPNDYSPKDFMTKILFCVILMFCSCFVALCIFIFVCTSVWEDNIKMNLREVGWGVAWTGSIWPRTGTGGGLL
jgi:hypothetical protein